MATLDPRDERVTELQRQIAMREYSVDSALVAEAMLRKMRLAQMVRGNLTDADAAGRSRPARAPRPQNP